MKSPIRVTTIEGRSQSERGGAYLWVGGQQMAISRLFQPVKKTEKVQPELPASGRFVS